jgi:DNA-binding NarL/FixJ family response regulator
MLDMRDPRLDLIDAAYRFDLSDDDTLEGMLDVYSRCERGPLVAFASRLEPSGEVRYLSLRTRRESTEVLARVFVEMTSLANGADLERLLYSTPDRHSLSSIVRADLHERVAVCGLTEFVGLNCPSHHGTGLALGVALPSRCIPTRRERVYWGPVARQLAAAFRVRYSGAWRSPAVIARGDGTIVEATGEAGPLLDRLRHAMRVRERARSRRGRRELWPELVAGRWTLADRFESDGRRYVIACRNEETGPRLRAIGPRERAVLDLVARGESNKAIALELGVSEPTVSRVVKDVLWRLGTNLAELVELMHATRSRVREGVALVALAPQQRATVASIAKLTASERAVVQLAIRGHSNHEIARLRRSALRTVANQLHAGFEKLGVRSRRELVLRFT